MRLLFLGLLALAAFGQVVRLHLKDGTYHVVREYAVEQDRVRYYSTERSEWEEIPLELVDLKKTEKERTEKQAVEEQSKADQEAEDDAARALRREARSIPPDPGIYRLDGKNVIEFAQAEPKVVTDKKRSVLKALAPIPIVTGKATVEIDGEHAAQVVREQRPEFWIRQSAEERMAIIRLAPKKGSRIVEQVTLIPVTNEALEVQDQIEVFRRQFGEGLFKIWPTKELAPGEYAVVQYTEGKLSVQVWDFRVE